VLCGTSLDVLIFLLGLSYEAFFSAYGYAEMWLFWEAGCVEYGDTKFPLALVSRAESLGIPGVTQIILITWAQAREEGEGPVSLGQPDASIYFCLSLLHFVCSLHPVVTDAGRAGG